MGRKRSPEDGPLYDPLVDISPVHDIDDVTPTFKCRASLRVFGDSLDFDEISRALSLTPTMTHRKGDRRSPKSNTLWLQDMWSYDASVPEERPLTEHIDALWLDVGPSAEYLLSLKARATVDVFLGYRSDWVDGGIEVPDRSLEMFRALEVPFSLSIIRI